MQISSDEPTTAGTSTPDWDRNYLREDREAFGTYDDIGDDSEDFDDEARPLVKKMPQKRR